MEKTRALQNLQDSEKFTLRFATKSPYSLCWLKWEVNKKSSKFITFLKSNNTHIANKSKDILGEFTTFYKNLYTSVNPSFSSFVDFLHSTSFVKELMEDHMKMMDRIVHHLHMVFH